MLQHVHEFCPAHWQWLKFRRKQPADPYAQFGIENIHQDQGQQESGSRQADKTDKRKKIVGDRILFYGHKNADWYGKTPTDDKSQEGNEKGHPHAAQQDLVDWPIPQERITEIQFRNN